MSKKLIMMCGIPGSGKSTWIVNHEFTFNPSHIVVSRDEIRLSLLNYEDEYFAKEKEVWREYIKQIKYGLENFEETYVDATLLNPAARNKLKLALGKSLVNVEIHAVAFNVPVKVCLERNETRFGRSHVPPTSIRNMATSYVIPTLEEGFDKIYIYYPDSPTKYIIYKKEVN